RLAASGHGLAPSARARTSCALGGGGGLGSIGRRACRFACRGRSSEGAAPPRVGPGALRGQHNAREAMPKLPSSISSGSDEFKANAAAMRALIADLAAKRAVAALGGPERLRERHVSRGKLLPRDRVLRLIDPGSPFLGLSPFAALDLSRNEI